MENIERAVAPALSDGLPRTGSRPSRTMRQTSASSGSRRKASTASKSCRSRAGRDDSATYVQAPELNASMTARTSSARPPLMRSIARALPSIGWRARNQRAVSSRRLPNI